MVALLSSPHPRVRSAALSTLVFFSCAATPRNKLLLAGIVPAVKHVTSEALLLDSSAGKRLRCVGVILCCVCVRGGGQGVSLFDVSLCMCARVALCSMVLEHLAGDEGALTTIMEEGCVQVPRLFREL